MRAPRSQTRFRSPHAHTSLGYTTQKMSQVLLEKGLPLRVRKKGRTKGPNWHVHGSRRDRAGKMTALGSFSTAAKAALCYAVRAAVRGQEGGGCQG